jgi:predicted nuclease with TOPRIM domain
MADQSIADHIEALVKEEHELLDRGGTEHGLDEAGHERLAAIRVELDRYWDLLRRRRAQERVEAAERRRQV